METLEQLNGFGAEAFETWLELRFRAQYSGDSAAEYRAFDFRELGIQRGDSQMDSAVALFNRLQVDAKHRFRAALQRLLRHVSVREFPPEAMSNVVSLVGRVQAFEAFGAFVPVIGTGAWGEVHRWLVYDALSVILTYPRAVESYDAARGLATSRNFVNSYVFQTYAVLIASRPENWLIDLLRLLPRFVEFHREVQKSADLSRLSRWRSRVQTLAQNLAFRVPLSLLGEKIINLSLSKTPSDPLTEFIQSLFSHLVGPEGPLRLQWTEDQQALCLIDRANESRQERLPWSDRFEFACIRFRYVAPPQDATDRETSWAAPPNEAYA
jgi:hypothetical protein